MISMLSRIKSKKDSVLSSSFSFDNPFLQRRKRPFRPSHPYSLLFDYSSNHHGSLYYSSSSKTKLQQCRNMLAFIMMVVAITFLVVKGTLLSLRSNVRPMAAHSNILQPEQVTAPTIRTTAIHLPTRKDAPNSITDRQAAADYPTHAASTASSCDCFSATDQTQPAKTSIQTSFSTKTTSTSLCCQRLALRAHKMGVVLLRDYLPNVASAIINPNTLPLAQDYRHVVLTRPLRDAILSGYLYHKTGRECWLDQNGAARQVNKTFAWTTRLEFPVAWNSNSNNSNSSSAAILLNNDTTTGVTLCEYLQTTADVQQNEYQAMKTYMDWSLNDLYAGLVPYYNKVQERHENKTLFVCFDELSSLQTQGDTLRRMRHWLFPSRNVTSTSERRKVVDNAVKQPESAATTKSYQGGHATSKDPELRQRLLELIAKLDRDVFQSRSAEATALFGCDKKGAS
ncbi:hypothetical protein MPSEU_000112300 [Mayamaea pseudoterrestris]|nr:hypothetical protein MPSEU_000112300 [Mayamaea pseudoterrestris]